MQPFVVCISIYLPNTVVEPPLSTTVIILWAIEKFTNFKASDKILAKNFVCRFFLNHCAPCCFFPLEITVAVIMVKLSIPFQRHSEIFL